MASHRRFVAGTSTRKTTALLRLITSVGIAEVERYLMARERGGSRAVALEELRARGMHPGFGKQLERRLGVIVSRGKALWLQAAERQLDGLAWIRAACAPRCLPRRRAATRTRGQLRGDCGRCGATTC